LDQELTAARTVLSERQRQEDERAAQRDEQQRALTERFTQTSATLEQQRAALNESMSTCAKLEQRATNYAQREAEIADLRAQLVTSRAEIADKVSELAVLSEQLEGEKRIADERQKMLETSKQQQEETLKGIAAQVLQQNTEKFETNTKVCLTGLLAPLAEQIKEHKARVEDAHKRDIEDRSALRAELQQMVMASKKLDQEAVNLTRALKGGSQVQGAWGEITLERILEQSGMRDGVEFERQTTFVGDDNQRLRPDVVVRLPGGRSVVVDSKVSLVAYSEFVTATDDESAADAMRRHMTAVRAQIKDLADKEYWRINSLDTGDYVLMFLPIESAFADTVRQDGGLFEEAFRNNVVLAAPSTLLATLRTIEHSWRVERQNETARAVVEQAGKLYDKFCGFVEDLEKVGTRLRLTQESYDGAMRKLSTGRGNLVRQADQLRSLGLKTRRALPSRLDDGDSDAATSQTPDEDDSTEAPPSARPCGADRPMTR
ncbi:MAG: DNA recombination protein RmuC, partial [Polyangiales bacterium]